MELYIGGTGHRPERLGLDYSAESNRKLTFFAKRMIEDAAKDTMGVAEIVSGFAQGWDLAMAHAAIILGIPLVAAIPFDGHPNKWPEPARRRYDAILARAAHVQVVCPGHYAPWKFIERDKWIVRRILSGNGPPLLMALFDGRKSGGTWKTIKFASEQKGLQIMNLWGVWSSEAPHDDNRTSCLR